LNDPAIQQIIREDVDEKEHQFGGVPSVHVPEFDENAPGHTEWRQSCSSSDSYELAQEHDRISRTLVGRNLMSSYSKWKEQNGSGVSMPEVVILQEGLDTLGYDPNGIDGLYGRGVFKAVQEFQQKEGLGVDGQAGPITLRAMAALLHNAESRSTVHYYAEQSQTFSNCLMGPMQHVMLCQTSGLSSVAGREMPQLTAKADREFLYTGFSKDLDKKGLPQPWDTTLPSTDSFKIKETLFTTVAADIPIEDRKAVVDSDAFKKLQKINEQESEPKTIVTGEEEHNVDVNTIVRVGMSAYVNKEKQTHEALDKVKHPLNNGGESQTAIKSLAAIITYMSNEEHNIKANKTAAGRARVASVDIKFSSQLLGIDAYTYGPSVTYPKKDGSTGELGYECFTACAAVLASVTDKNIRLPGCVRGSKVPLVFTSTWPQVVFTDAVYPKKSPTS
jgi:peptidoglycan hydrolase-like protein with peptidoglycan-binding domain